MEGFFIGMFIGVIETFVFLIGLPLFILRNLIRVVIDHLPFISRVGDDLPDIDSLAGGEFSSAQSEAGDASAAFTITKRISELETCDFLPLNISVYKTNDVRDHTLLIFTLLNSSRISP